MGLNWVDSFRDSSCENQGMQVLEGDGRMAMEHRFWRHRPEVKPILKFFAVALE